MTPAIAAPKPRKGASRINAVPPEILHQLEQGQLSTATLSENLAINQARLLQAVFPDAGEACFAQANAAAEAGIVKRMACMAALLLERYGPSVQEHCQQHASDTVRGWACFMLSALPGVPLAERLVALQALADDPHFGVREWAWIALRPHLLAELETAITLLTPWSHEPAENLRRFACEALRPRGVWCAHSSVLKANPELALPILEPLATDPSLYVQKSVGNWLNDASKTRPDWVAQLCQTWLSTHDHAATRYICKRAGRSLS